MAHDLGRRGGRSGSMANAPADARDIAAVDRYVAQVSQSLTALGVQPQQMAHWLGRRNLMTLRLAPTMAFRQTPGPHAGERLPDPGA